MRCRVFCFFGKQNPYRMKSCTIIRIIGLKKKFESYMAKEVTKRSENYSQWYNDLVIKADLAEQSPVRGCMVIKPYGYAIWEKMQSALDKMFK